MPSYYEAVPIFRAAMDCDVAMGQTVAGFSKAHKYTIGARLREGAERTVIYVARANRRSERDRWIQELCNVGNTKQVRCVR